ncbi:hypothetical protein RHS03_09033, partial [Rhizoctonia solani]
MDIDVPSVSGESHVSLDLGNLAATIALASEALAAAAEALAEAARAISTVGDTFKNDEDTKSTSNVTLPINVPDKPGNSSLERDQAIITESNNSQSDHNNQSTSIGQQSTSRFERGIKTTSTPIPSRPPTPVHLSMGVPTYHSNTQQPEKAAGPSRLTPAPERELNNKSTTLPPSSVVSTPNLPNTTLTRVAEKSRASEPESLLGVMKSHPAFPPGRNYIPLDQPADALAFIAYMALQARLIVCVIPSSRQSLYTQTLRSLTDSNVYCIDKPQDYVKYLTSSAQAKSTSQDILLTPSNNCLLNWGWMQESQPDCILHWTQPASVYFFTTRNVVNSLPRTVLACVLVVGENSFDANAHGVTNRIAIASSGSSSPSDPSGTPSSTTALTRTQIECTDPQ